MKRSMTLIWIILMLAVFPAQTVDAASKPVAKISPVAPPSIVVDGKLVYSDVPPVEEKGRILVPIRTVSDAVEGELNWIPEKNV